jgi:sugar transferase (PEP-CTERM system associated)
MQTVRSFASRLTTLQIIWIAIDLAAAMPAFVLAVVLRFSGNLAEAELSVGAIAPRALLFAVLIIVGLVLTGMYRSRQRVRPGQVFTHAAVSVAIGGLLNILVYYLYPAMATGRGVLLLAMLLAVVSIYATRRMFATMAEAFVRRRGILVIGAGRAAQKIAMRRRQADRRRYEVVAYLETAGDLPGEDDIKLEPRFKKISDLNHLAFDEVVLALDNRRGAIPPEALFNFRQRGAEVVSLVDFLEREAGQVDIDVADSNWFIFTKGCHTSPGYLMAKRVTDVLGSIFLLAALSPILLLVCVALYVEGKGKEPILYRQLRVGLRGQPFELLKFRSMRVDAERDGPAWAAQDDDRVTAVGRVIRRLRLDETPQLLNILKGQMSIVGPRPERPEFLNELAQQIPMYRYRLLVKPGLAGWAQLSFPYGASISDAREKLKYDLYYIKNARCMLDLFILAHTLEVVIWGQSVSMSGRNTDAPWDLPSARLPNWLPRIVEIDTAEATAANDAIMASTNTGGK